MLSVRRMELMGFTILIVAVATLCTSSCVIAWVGGSKCFISSVGNALVGAYLNQLGMSESAITYITPAAAKG